MSTTYPIAADVTSLLTSIGVTLPGSFSVDPYVKTAISMFERRTGWVPFLATTETTQYYDAPGLLPKVPYFKGGGGNTLRLRTGLLSVSSLTVEGTPKVLGSDYFMLPGPGDWPCEALRFAWPIYASSQSIAITGKWGFTDDLDPAAWDAIRQEAAANAIDSVLERIRSAGIDSVRDDDVTISYNLLKMGAEASGFHRTFDMVVKAFERVTAGI